MPLIFLKARRRFEFVDISPLTLCMDEEIVLSKWRKHPGRYSGLIFVRTYGMVHDISEMLEELRELSQDALIVDDRCLGIPEVFDKPPANINAVLFSTGYAKFVDLGFGGYGILDRNTAYSGGTMPYNSAASDTLDASYKYAIANKLPFVYSDTHWLDTRKPSLSWDDYLRVLNAERSRMITHKAAINALYSEMLPANVQLPSHFHAWRFNIVVASKSLLLRSIRQADLFASDHYASLAGIFGKEHARNAEALHNKVINLFNDKYFDFLRAEKLVDVIVKHLRRSVPGK